MKNNLTVLLTLVWVCISDAVSPTIEFANMLFSPGEVCYDDVHDFASCWSLEFTGRACDECLLAGQPDPENPTCSYIDCSEIGDCGDDDCGLCNSEFIAISNCALNRDCNMFCRYPGDPCYEELAMANECPSSVTEMNDCISCYQMNPTCLDTDCNAYEDCLNRFCGNCVSVYMNSYACLDEMACGFHCTYDGQGFRKLGTHRNHVRKLDTSKSVNGPPPKPH